MILMNLQNHFVYLVEVSNLKVKSNLPRKKLLHLKKKVSASTSASPVIKKPQAIRTSTQMSTNLSSNDLSSDNLSNGTVTSQILMGNNTPSPAKYSYSENNRFTNRNSDDPMSESKPLIQQSTQKRKVADQSDTKQSSEPAPIRTSLRSSSSATTATTTTKQKDAPERVKRKQEKTSPFLALLVVFIAIGLLYVFKPYLIP